jgi:Mg/Co/Ni transporter MgtE
MPRGKQLPALQGTLAKDVIDNDREIAADMEVIIYVYGTDEDNVLQGVVDLRELISADKAQSLGDITTDSLMT